MFVYMAALRAPRFVAIVATVLFASLAQVGPARAAGPTLDVTREITVTGAEAAILTATISDSQSTPTTIRAEVLPTPGNTPTNLTAQCTIATGERECTINLISKQASTNDVRIWIDGQAPDTSEGRFSGKQLLGFNDCVGEEASVGGILGQSECEESEEPVPGAAEPDATDVVRVQWLNFAEGRLTCDDGKAGDGTDVEYNNSVAGDRAEAYRCTLTTLAGVPIQGAFIDGEILSGPGQNSAPNAADLPDVCKTDTNGRCTTAPINMPVDGARKICFWGEPANKDDPTKGDENEFGVPGPDTDGGGCNAEPVDEPENNEITDAVYVDTGAPRAEGLDVQPENITVSGASRFSLRGVVFDQFGNLFKGSTTLQAKLFAGSALAPNGDNTVASLDPNLKCQTGGTESCTILTSAQNDLGQNLACMWIEGKAPTAMVGQADQDSATCTAPKAAWQSTADQEARFDATNDEDKPFPPSDGLDVVRFAVQSRPKISTVTPGDRRQDTSGDVLGVDGINFLPSALITISGSGVTLGPTAVVSSTRLEATLAVAADAPPGPRDITVTNRSDGGTVTCSGCFRVIGQGYWMVASDGGLFSFGDAKFVGSAGGQALNKPIVAMTPTPSGLGYWMVASDGGLFAYGDAPFVGSAGGLPLSRPIVDIAPTPSGRGYWMVASDGGVFNYGDAKFFGATSRLTLAKPIVSIVPTPSGKGYWLVASDGGIFSFGDAKFFGSTGNLVLNKPIVDMAPTKTGKGYWMVATDGGIFAYGDATFYGSTGAVPLNKPIVGMTATPFGKGYWMVASDGGVFSFGDARFLGSTGNITLNQPIVGLARR